MSTTAELDYWKFLAGLGFLLFGMNLLETSMRELAGREFKLFLKKYTKNRLLAVLNGVVATAVLRSSSIVLLMVIAFTGAGILTLSNSIGIVLGANLGTTITGWIVSSLGFSGNIDRLVYPLIGIGSLGLSFVSSKFRFYQLFHVLAAFGVLFLGLGFMRESMSQLSNTLDVAIIQSWGPWILFPIGFFVTAIIQSSSAMMTIVLSALHSQVISVESAAVLIIGADLGTTVTAILGSMTGSPARKRVGLAHFMINVVTGVIALVVLKPSLGIVSMMTSDPLYRLVAFHSAFNLIGVFLFLPFVETFEKFLNRFFIKEEVHACEFIHRVGVDIPEAAIEAVSLELRRFVRLVMEFQSEVLGLKIHTKADANGESELAVVQFFLNPKDRELKYMNIKKIEGELLDYFQELQRHRLEADEASQLRNAIVALRNGVQAAKSVNDIDHNIEEFRNSISEAVDQFLKHLQLTYEEVSRQSFGVWYTSDRKKVLEELLEILANNEKAYQSLNEWIYRHVAVLQESELEVATFLNVNREVFSSYKHLTECLRDMLLSPEAQPDINAGLSPIS